MFLDNFKYDYWILHTKIVLDEIYTIFHKITHISFNIGPRILNVHTMGHPFPLAGHNSRFLNICENMYTVKINFMLAS